MSEKKTTSPAPKRTTPNFQTEHVVNKGELPRMEHAIKERTSQTKK
jgi:hypothetical protein